MDRRPLGDTGLSVTRIGLGLAALGRPGYINLGHARDLGAEYAVESMRARTHAVLEAAWAAGLRYFDAARSYGRAEEFLGSWLQSRQIPPEAVVVGSKWGYTYTAGWKVTAERHEVKEHSLAVLARQVEESRSWLGTHLDLYQIHSATLESRVLESRDVLERLGRLRDEGLRIGLTTSGPNQGETLKRAMDLAIGGRRLFDCVQATWNLLERSAGAALEAAHACGMGVIIKEALANGRLTSRNVGPSLTRSRRLLEEAAAKTGATIDALGLAAVLAEPWVDVALSGATTVEQLQSNLTALPVRLDPAVTEDLRSLSEAPGAYWEIRSLLPWN